MSMFHVYILFLHNFDQIKIVHRVDHIIILSIFFFIRARVFWSVFAVRTETASSLPGMHALLYVRGSIDSV